MCGCVVRMVRCAVYGLGVVCVMCGVRAACGVRAPCVPCVRVLMSMVCAVCSVCDVGCVVSDDVCGAGMLLVWSLLVVPMVALPLYRNQPDSPTMAPTSSPERKARHDIRDAQRQVTLPLWFRIVPVLVR